MTTKPLKYVEGEQKWHQWTGMGDPTPLLPTRFNKFLAKQYILAGIKLNTLLNENSKSSFDSVTRYLITNDNESWGKIGRQGLSFYTGFNHYIATYLTGETFPNKPALDELGIERISDTIYHIPDPEKIINILRDREGFSYKSFIEFILNRIKPQYTEPALLYVGDGISEITAKHKDNIGEELEALEKAYSESGLKEVVEHIIRISERQQKGVIRL